MRLVTVTSIAPLALIVLMALACTATPATPSNTPNIDATVEAAISATKTAEEGEPNLTDQMLLRRQ